MYQRKTCNVGAPLQTRGYRSIFQIPHLQKEHQVWNRSGTLIGKSQTLTVNGVFLLNSDHNKPKLSGLVVSSVFWKMRNKKPVATCMSLSLDMLTKNPLLDRNCKRNTIKGIKKDLLKRFICSISLK